MFSLLRLLQNILLKIQPESQRALNFVQPEWPIAVEEKRYLYLYVAIDPIKMFDFVINII